MSAVEQGCHASPVFSLFSNELWTFALFKLARVDVGNVSKKGKNMEGIIT